MDQKKIKEANDLVKKVNDMKKQDSFDLSTDEDLSIAIMNLVSIEEHLYFSGIKTNKEKYFELLKPVREMRKELLQEIVKDPEGEVWCISKHLLAASMRLIEVGNKLATNNKVRKAYAKYHEAFQLYSLFWGVNSNLIDISELSLELIKESKAKDTVKDEELIKEPIAEKIPVGSSKMSRLTAAVKGMINCCRE